MLPVSRAMVESYAAGLPADGLTLDFLAPTWLEHAGKTVWQGPPFHVLVKALLGRISSLSYFHCGQVWEADFRGLIDRAAEVRAVQNETHWEERQRFSGRQEQWMEIGGLVGRVAYQGKLGDYLPLLALGELVHVGRRRSWQRAVSDTEESIMSTSISLAEFIRQVRQDLLDEQFRQEGAAPLLAIQEVEIEASVVATREGAGAPRAT